MRMHATGYGSPSQSSGGSIETGNRLGSRPVVRQSKNSRVNESGNAMKGLLGNDGLAWDHEKQEGVFKGKPVYAGKTGKSGPPGVYKDDPATAALISSLSKGGPPQLQHSPPPQQQFNPQQQRRRRAAQQPPMQQPPPQQKHVCFGGAANSSTAPERRPSQSSQQGAAASSFSPPQQVCQPVGEVPYPQPGSSASCDGCGQVVHRYYHCLDCPEHTGLFDLCVPCCGRIYLQRVQTSEGLMSPRVSHPTHDYSTHRMQHVVPPGQQ